MKRILYIIFALAGLLSAGEAPAKPVPEPSSAPTGQTTPPWKETGKVTLYSRDGNKMGTAQLYARQVQKKTDYKVKLVNGEEYAVAPNRTYDPKSTEFHRQCKYMAHVYFYIKDIK